MFEAIGRAIGRRAAEKAVQRHFGSDAFARQLAEIIVTAIRKEAAKPEHAWFLFVKQMQWRMREVDPTMTGKASFNLALNAYKDFLHNERIEFGDPRYDWSEDGARDLIQAMEIDHWESA